MMTIMKLNEVLNYLKIGRTTFYNYKKLGMPVHYPNGRNEKPFCYKEEIDQWLIGVKEHDERFYCNL